MADFTEKAIRDAFMKLLDERPLKQISVRDIVDECGVNRNTFYYHFQDIPQLMDSIIREKVNSIIEKNPRISSVEECLNAVVSLSLENQRAILHVYKSVNRATFEQYQWRLCEHVVNAYLDEVFAGRKISPQARDTIVTYGKCLCFGLVLGWLESGLREEEIHGFVHRLCVLKQGEIERMAALCEEKP